MERSRESKTEGNQEERESGEEGPREACKDDEEKARTGTLAVQPQEERLALSLKVPRRTGLLSPWVRSVETCRAKTRPFEDKPRTPGHRSHRLHPGEALRHTW